MAKPDKQGLDGQKLATLVAESGKASSCRIFKIW